MLLLQCYQHLVRNWHLNLLHWVVFHTKVITEAREPEAFVHAHTHINAHLELYLHQLSTACSSHIEEGEVELNISLW